MSFNLRNRSFLKELDFTPDELRFLLQALRRPQGRQVRRLRAARASTGKNIALIFEKTSTRTRTAFEVAAYDQGAHVTYLEPSGSQIGHKESMKDTARVLGPHLRRHRVPRLRPGRRRDPGGVRRRAGLERAHRRVPPDPDARRRPHHDRAQRQAPPRHRLLLPRRRPQQHGQLAAWSAAASSAWTSGCARPSDLWPHDDLVKTCREIAEETGARLTLTEDVDEGVVRRRLPLHRRVGVDGRGQERLGGADRAAHAVPGQHRRGGAHRATRR